MKKCKKCGEISDNFTPDKKNSDGLYSWCRNCKNKYHRKRWLTKDGLITKIYGHQRSHSLARGHGLPAYTMLDLREWCLSQDIFHTLFEQWKESGYSKNLIPSCDRTDDFKGYSLDRLQIMTWQENKTKSEEDVKNGKRVSSIPHKAVEQRNLDGKIIGTYFSVQYASRVTGVNPSNISATCRGKRNHAGGFKWNFVK